MTNEMRTRGAAREAGRKGNQALAVSLAWLAVGSPLRWGVVQTLRRSLALFG